MTQSHVLQPIGSLRLDDEDRQKIESRIGSNGIAISKHSLSFQPFFRNEQVSEIIPPFHFAEFDNAILSSYPLLVGKVPLAEQDILLTSLHLYLWNRLGYRNPYDATDFIQPGKVTPEKLIGKRSFVLARTFPITSADS